MTSLHTEQDIIDLIKQSAYRETEILEFKKAENQYSVLWSKENKNCVYGYCVGIGNSGWWILLLGVEDDGTIVGTNTKLPKDVKSKIFSKTWQNISIKTIVTSQWSVIVIQIPNRMIWQYYDFYGVPLMRRDDQLVPMDRNTITNIINETQEDWSQHVVENATIDDLDPRAIQKARLEYSIKNSSKIEKSEIDSWADEVFLNKAKLTQRWKITRTAILLLWKEESDFMLTPWTSKISRILKDRDGVEKDYEHFFAPLIMSVDLVYNKIRNLRYRYSKWDSIFPEETDMYDSYVLREMIHNAIAHQDYTLWWKINIVEDEDTIIISNQWSFLPWSVENVINADSPSEKYRNPFLANAMVNLRMIDTIGSGIKKSFIIQKDKLFPLPDYNFENDRVQVTIYGKVLDVNYARKLVQIPWLSLNDIVLLDKVQKKKELSASAVTYLKSKSLIEGKRPNFYISSIIAGQLNEKSDYIKQRWLKDSHYKKLILEYLNKYQSATKQDIVKLLFDLLPSILDNKQKMYKIKNIMYTMSKKDISIINTGTNRNSLWRIKGKII